MSGSDAASRTGLLFMSAGGADPGGAKYALYVPRAYTEPARRSEQWPLIVFLNGSGECGTDGQRQTTQGLLPAVLNKPEDWPFLILFPQKPESDSEWEDHDAMVMTQIARTREQFRVDPNRIYLTGLSQGGHGTWILGARHADVFAALAPVCGYGPGGYGVDPDPKAFAAVAGSIVRARVPVWAFHGQRDDVVSPKQTEMMVEALVAARRAEEGHPRPARPLEIHKTIYPDLNHGCWDRAYREGGAESTIEGSGQAGSAEGARQTIPQWFLSIRKR